MTIPTAMKRQQDYRAIKGCYVGTHERTGSALLATPSGVVRGGRIARLPEAQQFSWTFASTVRGVPWDFPVLQMPLFLMLFNLVPPPLTQLSLEVYCHPLHRPACLSRPGILLIPFVLENLGM